jgi:NAD(P)H dehydrogenase (quinone)
MVRPSRILIVFYSRYGNIAKIAEEITYGAKEVFNIQLTIRRIADDIPIQVISKNPEWTKVAEDLNDRYPTTPITLIVNELPNYDAIIFGSPPRFGNMAAPMKAMCRFY